MGIVVYMVVVVYMVCWKRRRYVQKKDISRNAIYEMMQMPNENSNIPLEHIPGNPK